MIIFHYNTIFYDIMSLIFILLTEVYILLSISTLCDLCLKNNPLMSAPIKCANNIHIPSLALWYIPTPTVPSINSGPDVLANDVMVDACSKSILPSKYSSEVSFAPTGYPEMMLIRYMYPASPPTPYNFFVMGESNLPIVDTILVLVSILVKIKNGSRDGKTLVAQRVSPV